MGRILRFLLLPCVIARAASAPAVSYQPAIVVPPQPVREFRGAWVATIANIDWPSKPGLSVAEQKAELLALLDRSAQLHLNAIIFQVRPMCDAFYASSLEPWSEYLTGTMGKAPEPFYDPLAFAVEEAHKRGLELHAWFNPYRAVHFLSKSPVAPNHISRTRPELVRKYSKYLWLDPGEPDVRTHSLNVVMDVVKRYDIDGVQFDDYFYPAERGTLGRYLDFPDAASWTKYGARSGLNRDDWRRENVNTFVQRVYQSIKTAKPWVKFGISPFGIWRPGHPPQIRGNDAYAVYYADSRKWLADGWLDYCAPQLYWPIDSREQSFPLLLRWWAQQNEKARHLWPGLYAAEAGGKLKLDEIARQIQAARDQPGVTGEIHYHLRSLTTNHALADSVLANYSQPALVPASPWLDSTPPGQPTLIVSGDNHSGVYIRWEPTGNKQVRRWLLQYRAAGTWTTEILPLHQNSRALPSSAPEVIAISAVDRVGNSSAPATMALRPQPTAPPHETIKSNAPKSANVQRKTRKITSPRDSDGQR